MKEKASKLDSVILGGRRDLLKTGIAGAALAASYGRVAAAAGSDELRVGLVGCGGRGTGAIRNIIQSKLPNVKLIAMGDVFKDRMDESLKNLGKVAEDNGAKDVLAVTPDKMFTGFDAYQKVLATDCHYVVLASPPGFRPAHLRAAVAAGKHIFTEKPMAVDGPGIRTCFEVAEEAAKKKLGIGVGLQRHHSKGYLEAMKRIRGGAVGEVVGGRVFWLQRDLWFKPRQPTWSDTEWQMRNWLYFTWLSGDHIVEQHIHHLDGVIWVLGKAPVKAVGMGGRVRRQTGDQYDFFSVDYTFDNGVHMHSTIRQVSGCVNLRDETFVGTKGSASLDQGAIFDRDGKVVWKFQGEGADSLVQEHADFVRAIRSGPPINTAKDTAISTLVAIMGRESAYTGKAVTYDDLLASTMRLGPESYVLGPVNLPAVPPLAGQESAPLSQ